MSNFQEHNRSGTGNSNRFPEEEGDTGELFEFKTISIYDKNGETVIPLYSCPSYLRNSNNDFEEILFSKPRDSEFFEPYFLWPKVRFLIALN